ncbi:hypothetical protein OWR29_30390 [Actinoplanes sp. Pm04-4]|uniref:Uncharacterized protein n=1 Tax=Paractinoplanes pyxinae TaxID=2997416 RepID=A0ABT4B739_9ACTN|nr:hypothetical protein [Actinoplanes pyxinae]MCY1142327.1 hypothetical protein [Actinoplanes pyxinae]
MSDDRLDRAVRDADPYRPRDLDGAEQILLEEIMSVPSRRPLARRIAVAAAAAAVVTGGLAATALINHPEEKTATSPVPVVSAPAKYSTVALRMAEESPRLLVDEPGWKATTAYGFAEQTGTIVYTKAGLSLEMNWYPGDQYGSYHDDRRDVSSPAPVTIDGWKGDLFKYSDTRFAVMLQPRDGVFVELGTASDGWTRSEFDRVSALIHRVGVETWLEALPPEIVTPEKAAKEAAKVLAGVPMPPGFEITALSDLGTNDHYQFVAGVTGRVGCAWIAEWIRADKAGDQAAKQKAATALRGSSNWKALRQIADEGGWSSVFWEVTSQTAASGPPAGYKDAIGCA